MIKFFSTIRQNLISKGKTSKYLKYALGEIVLVVIGILIAVQINDWNDNRIKRKKENKFIAQIHNEFISNRVQFDTVRYYHLRGYNYTRKIISMFPIDIEKANLDSLSSYIIKTFDYWTFNPQQSAINSLSNTSSFDIISNMELKMFLQNWNELVSDYREEEEFASEYNFNYYFPYFRKKIAFSNIKKGENIFKHPNTDATFLNDLEFENLIHNRMAFIRDIVDPPRVSELSEISKTIDRIIALTSPE